MRRKYVFCIFEDDRICTDGFMNTILCGLFGFEKPKANLKCFSSDAGSNSRDDTNSTETIEKMFEEVLEYAGSAEEEGRVEEDGEDHDSGIGSCSVVKSGEKIEREEEPRGEECDENDELLTFPQSGILSPLSKSLEAVVTPLVRVVYTFALFQTFSDS